MMIKLQITENIRITKSFFKSRPPTFNIKRPITLQAEPEELLESLANEFKYYCPEPM